MDGGGESEDEEGCDRLWGVLVDVDAWIYMGVRVVGMGVGSGGVGVPS